MDGRTVTIKCNGLLARCLQHEVDHLHGSLFTDIVSPQDPEKVIRRLRLTHPDAFEEDDDSYARRMKEERRRLAQAAQGSGHTPENRVTHLCKKAPASLSMKAGANATGGSQAQLTQSSTTLPDLPEFMASKPSRNSV